MPDLLDQINEAEGRLQSLLNGEGELTERERLLVASLENKLASLRSLQLVEAQRGEMLVCFTTVMLDEFSIDFEINLSHVCHLLIRNIKSIQMLNQRLAFLRRRYFAQLNPVLESFVTIS